MKKILLIFAIISSLMAFSEGEIEELKTNSEIGFNFSDEMSKFNKSMIVNEMSDFNNNNRKNNNKIFERQLEQVYKKYLGVKYVWGGNSPKGLDCSSLTKRIFGEFKINLPRTASQQAKLGIRISKKDLKAGDLLFFHPNSKSKRISHVGVYIGNGKMIHASSTNKKVVIVKLNEYKYFLNNFSHATRIK